MKTLKVGITGGIGVGKSFVANIFKSMNIPFYDADQWAKELMNSDESIRQGLIEAFGQSVYFDDGTLNRKWLSSRVFNDNAQLETLNGIVHPVVIQHAKDWAQRQKGCYSLKEAALLFESGSYTSLDYTILVVAPLALRVQRVMQRDEVSQKQVEDRISKQWPEEQKRKLADFIIVNDGIEPLLPQINNIHKQLTSRC